METQLSSAGCGEDLRQHTTLLRKGLPGEGGWEQPSLEHVSRGWTARACGWAEGCSYWDKHTSACLFGTKVRASEGHLGGLCLADFLRPGPQERMLSSLPTEPTPRPALRNARSWVQSQAR